MTISEDYLDRAARIERIRSIVNEDYERIMHSDSPYTVLNVSRDCSLDEVTNKYERYERFYRADNFQRLGDIELTRKALDIRRAIGKAMIEIQAGLADQSDNADKVSKGQTIHIPSVDSDSAALADVLYRDGLAYYRIGDLQQACRCFERAIDHNSTRGVFQAYLGYTSFRRFPFDNDIIEEAENRLDKAKQMDREDIEVALVRARYYIRRKAFSEADAELKRAEDLQPDHPLISRLRRKLHKQA